jgi:hypothetical protein
VEAGVKGMEKRLRWRVVWKVFSGRCKKLRELRGSLPMEGKEASLLGGEKTCIKVSIHF